VDNVLISLVNTLKQSQQKSEQSPQDDRLFSQLLEEQVKEGKKDKSSDATSFISREKEKEKPKNKEGAKVKKEELSLLHNFLYNLARLNPDAMSLAQKQGLRLDDNFLGEIGIKELQKLMAQRGLKLQELTADQINQLIQRNNKGQLVSYLDELVKEKRERMDATPRARADMEPSQRTPEMKQSSPQTSYQSGSENTREEVIQQIIQHLELQKLQDGTQLTMKLNPAFLGELGLMMEVEGSKVTARFQTTSRRTREILENSFDELKKALQDKGLTVTTVRVNLVEEIV